MSRSERVPAMKRWQLVIGSALAAGGLHCGRAADAPQVRSRDSGKLQEIVVTAERRAANVQDAAASISVRSGAQLLREGRYSMQQIMEDVPGVMVVSPANDVADQMASGGTDTEGDNITIRGIGANSAPSTLPSVPTTAVYTDGVYEGIGGNYDIARVEVLRGPQGTLYGRSATAGVVAIHTQDPSFSAFGGDASVEFGNYALKHYTAAFNLPVNDTVAIRISGDEYQRGGYYSSQGGALKQTSGRIKVLYRPTDDLSVLFGAALENNRVHTGGEAGYLTAPNTIVYNEVPVKLSLNDFRQYWLHLKWNLPFGELSYLPAVRTWHENANFYATGPFNFPLSQFVDTPFDQFLTQELHLASKPGSKITWQAGAFWYDNRLHNLNDITWQSSGGLLANENNRKETKDWGVFAQATYPFSEATRLTGGLRYDYTYAQTSQVYTSNVNLLCNVVFPCAGGSGPGLPLNLSSLTLNGDAGIRHFHNITYTGRLEHDLTRHNLLYATISTGFLPGDVQVTTGAGNLPVVRPYAEETLTSYEVGTKNRFLDDTLQINGDVFFYHYGGYQVSGAGNPTNPSTFFLAVVPAKVKGAELELLYQLTPRDRVGINYSYTDAYYFHEPVDFVAYVAQTHITGVAPQTASGWYEHGFQLPGGSTFALRIDGRWSSPYDLANLSPLLAAEGGGAFIRTDSRLIGDITGAWDSVSGRYSVSAYVRNIGNNRSLASVSLQTLVPTVIANAAQFDPRTFGVVISAHF
jgi:outer membrane receptor protein involved in Fe transport